MSSLAPMAFDPSRPPPAPGMGRGFALAVLAHAVLVIGLSAGVQWRSKTEPAFEAELWAAVPVAAAPREEAPPPEPEPELKTPPKPEPPPPDLQAERDAEIAIAKAREKKREDAEAKRLAELEAQRKQKLREQQEQKDKTAKTLKEQQAREQKLKDDKARLEAKKADALADKRAEDQRQANLRRIQGMAGASGGPQATGTALQSAGPSPTYGGRIKARIRPNIIYADAGAGNPNAEVEVRAAPDGSIIGRKLLKSSGDAEWDKAVLRAIDKTEILPRDVDGRVPAHLVITFQPRE
jgi:colicin import membrane protein